jgi:uncharacterized protein (TIGR03086 family)
MDFDPAPLFERAGDWAAGIFAGVKVDQLDDPTPCEDWDVRELINHVIGSNYFFAAAVSDGPGGGDQEEAPDFAAGDPGQAYRASTEAVLAAYALPGAYEKITQTPGGEMPGVQLFAIAMTEQLLHGWDLAKATGQDTTLDAELATITDNMLRPNIDGAVAGGFYKAAVGIPDDASPGDKLIALVGRQP